MSKGSNTDDINIAYLDKLTEAVVDMAAKLDKISPSYGAHGQLEKELSNLAKYVQSGDMTLKQMLKEGAAAQKNIRSVEYGLESTSKYNRTINMFVKLLEEKMGSSKIDDVLIKKLTTAFENLDVTAILESEKIGQRGGKGAPLKNVMDNEKLNKVNEDLAKRIGLKMDEAQYKLMTFFQEQEQKRDKKTASFVNDLIEGLEKSKWVGGALRDTFRLVGLLGANWLSQFGQLGRILGGAFYVAMETAGPLLVNLLLKGMGSLLGKLFVGGMGWKMLSALPQNGPLGNAVTTFYAGGTGAQKAAALKGLVGPTLAATAAFAGGGWALGQAGDSWQQGRKGNAAAFGIGGAALIGGGIAAIVAGLTAPITVPLLAIGAAVVAIAALWKKFGSSIQDFFKERKEEANKSFSKYGSFMDWLKDVLPWGKGGSDDEEGIYKGVPKKAGVIQSLGNVFGSDTFGKLKIGKDGAVLNASSLSQQELKAQMEAYQKANPEQFGRIYEVVSSKYANVKGFKNDAIMTDQLTGQTGALMYAGASADMERIRALAREAGMSESAVNRILYTGGWSTGKGEHKRNPLSVASSIGHDNPYALAYDIGLAGFSKKEQEIILGAAQQTAKERAERIGGKGAKIQDVYHEISRNGEYVLSKGYQEGANQLIHTQLYRGYNLPSGARENLAQQKAIANNYAGDLGDVLSFVDNETYKFASERASKLKLDDEDRTNYYKTALKSLGVEEDPDLKGQYRKLNKETGVYEYIAQDKSGNLQWTMHSAVMSGIANQGATGRY